jgi:NADH-quinone oxidoreductase subunit M
MMLVPWIGGLLILAIPAAHARIARFVALLFCLETFILSLVAVSRFDWTRLSYVTSGNPVQLVSRYNWIRGWGIQYFIGVDGLSMPLVVLATGVVLLACWASYGIAKSTRGYYALLLFLLAAVIGVFVSLNLVLFYVFFEAALVPIYLLIGMWGGSGGGVGRRDYAAIKLFLYSMVGAIAFLLVILGLYPHVRSGAVGQSGVFDMIHLATDSAIRLKFTYGGAGFGFGQVGFWLLVVAFGIRMPVVPVHTWLADAQVEAPTPVSMLLAGIVVPTGAYGILRVAYPLFPVQAADAWFYVGVIAVGTILYGALMALAQKDLKRVVSCVSMAGMGYVLLGLAVMNPLGTAGAMYQLISIALASVMVFFVVGILDDRAHHREIRRLGGLWSQMPAFTGWAILGFFALMGLPGLCGFVGQLLVLLGVFSAADTGAFLMGHSSGTAFIPLLWFGVLGAGAMVLTAAALLWTFQRVFMGAPKPEYHHFASLTRSEKWILGLLGVTVVVLGVLPMGVLNAIRPGIDGMMRLIAG